MAALGEAIINLIVGILILILQFLLMVVAFLLDTIIYTFSFMFDSNFMHKLYLALPIISKADDALTMMGLAVAIILLCVMIIHMGITPLVSGGKNVPYPSLIIIRTLLVIPLVICAEKVSIYLSNLFTSFYTIMLSIYDDQLTTKFYLTSALSVYFEDGMDTLLSTPTESMQAIQDGMGFTESVMSTLSSAVGIILVLFLVILVGWNLIQLFLEMFERFATMFFLMKISPLTLATAIYPSSEKVAKSWVSFFIGQFCVWVLQIMCMGWVIGCLGDVGQFEAAFPDSKITAMVCWAGISYGLINMSRHIDDYINKLGLTAAVTGSDFFQDIASMAGAIRTGKSIAKATGDTVKGAAGAAKGAVQTAKNMPGTLLGAANRTATRFTDGMRSSNNKVTGALKGSFNAAKGAVGDMASTKVGRSIATLAAAGVAATVGAPIVGAVAAGTVARGAASLVSKNVQRSDIKGNIARNVPHRKAPAGSKETAKVGLGFKDKNGLRDYKANYLQTDKNGNVISQQSFSGKVGGNSGTQIQSANKTFDYSYDKNTNTFNRDGQQYQTVFKDGQYVTCKVGSDGKLEDTPVYTHAAKSDGSGGSEKDLARESYRAARKMK